MPFERKSGEMLQAQKSRQRPPEPLVKAAARACRAILEGGGVGEWLKPAVLKTVRPVRVSGVRIPPPPPENAKVDLELEATSISS